MFFCLDSALLRLVRRCEYCNFYGTGKASPPLSEYIITRKSEAIVPLSGWARLGLLHVLILVFQVPTAKFRSSCCLQQVKVSSSRVVAFTLYYNSICSQHNRLRPPCFQPLSLLCSSPPAYSFA